MSSKLLFQPSIDHPILLVNTLECMCEPVQKHRAVDSYFQNEVEAQRPGQESRSGVDEGWYDQNVISKRGLAQTGLIWVVGLGGVDVGW